MHNAFLSAARRTLSGVVLLLTAAFAVAQTNSPTPPTVITNWGGATTSAPPSVITNWPASLVYPRYVTVDPASGIVTWPVDFWAVNTNAWWISNRVALARQLTARGLYQPTNANGLCLTPPMGWSEWNCWYGQTNGCLPPGYTQGGITAIVDAMKTNGLLSAGYNIILPDVGMYGARDTNGTWTSNTNVFPNGLAWLGDYIHTNGFLYGVYATRGLYSPTGVCDNCERGFICPASTGYETNDALYWAGLGADYLKYDNMTASSNSLIVDLAQMAKALRNCGRDIIYNICTGPSGFDHGWAELGHSWRTTSDINFWWSNVVINCYVNARSRNWAGPGHFNDPDMLEVGNRAWPVNYPVMTTNEWRSHFALWCVSAAPLILGSDVRTNDALVMGIFTNRALIAVDQDAAGIQGYCVATNNGVEIWSKPLGSFGSGTNAVVLFNPTGSAADVTVYWTNLLLYGSARVHDLWKGVNYGSFSGSFTTNVASHDSLALRVEGVSYGEPVFLSDLPTTNLYWQPESVTRLVRDRNAQTNIAKVGYVEYVKAIGLKAPGSVTWGLNLDWLGTPTRFVAEVGVDAASTGTAVVAVWADGVKLWQSGTLTQGEQPHPVSLDLTGRRNVSVAVTNLTGDSDIVLGNARVLVQLADVMPATVFVPWTPASGTAASSSTGTVYVGSATWTNTDLSFAAHNATQGGRAVIYHPGGNYSALGLWGAGETTANYANATLIGNGSETAVNVLTGGTGYLRVNNSDVASWTASGLSMAAGKRLNGALGISTNVVISGTTLVFSNGVLTAVQ